MPNRDKITKKHSEAEALYKKILKQSNDANAWINLALIYGATHRESMAIDAYNSALLIAPDNIQALGNMGFLLYQQGDLAKAEGLLQSALRADKNYLPAIRNLASLYLKQKRIREAVPLVRQLCVIQPDKSTELKLALLLIELENYAEAKEILFKLQEWGQLQFLMRRSGHWDGLDEVDAKCLRAIRQNPQCTDEPHALTNIPT
ncbi:MAG: tetratricopeptide repeat protein, partial [Pseudomonadales bacterium]|nr:tetratricopeptide repeat protein [Pseudomonadales bacterium]